MRVYDFPDGRLGNLIFRYFASALFRMNYGASRGVFGEPVSANDMILRIEDEDFIKWIHEFIYGVSDKDSKTYFFGSPPIEQNSNVYFFGYFQNDFFAIFRRELLEFMEKHSDEVLFGKTPQNQIISYRVEDIIRPPKNINIYDIVIHIRLEDFLDDNIRGVVRPECLDEVIKDIIKSECHVLAGGKICLLCNEPKMAIEQLYIDYFRSRYAIELVSNDVITDFHIMKSAKILVCSLSTLSWCAAIMSTRLEKVYIPKNKTSSSQKFEYPIKNSILYDNRMCGETELREFFNIPSDIIMEVPENREKQKSAKRV